MYSSSSNLIAQRAAVYHSGGWSSVPRAWRRRWFLILLFTAVPRDFRLKCSIPSRSQCRRERWQWQLQKTWASFQHLIKNQNVLRPFVLGSFKEPSINVRTLGILWITFKLTMEIVSFGSKSGRPLCYYYKFTEILHHIYEDDDDLVATRTFFESLLADNWNGSFPSFISFFSIEEYSVSVCLVCGNDGCWRGRWTSQHHPIRTWHLLRFSSFFAQKTCFTISPWPRTSLITELLDGNIFPFGNGINVKCFSSLMTSDFSLSWSAFSTARPLFWPSAFWNMCAISLHSISFIFYLNSGFLHKPGGLQLLKAFTGEW